MTTNSFFCASACASKRLSLLCNFSKRDVSSVNCDANVLLPEGRLLRNSAKASFWSCNLFNSFDCSFFAADSLEWSLEFIDEDEAACDKVFWTVLLTIFLTAFLGETATDTAPLLLNFRAAAAGLGGGKEEDVVFAFALAIPGGGAGVAIGFFLVTDAVETLALATLIPGGGRGGVTLAFLATGAARAAGVALAGLAATAPLGVAFGVALGVALGAEWAHICAE